MEVDAACKRAYGMSLVYIAENSHPPMEEGEIAEVGGKAKRTHGNAADALE